MCGIAGFIDHSTQADAGVLSTMLEQIRHRGPDDFGGFVDQGVALGSARLSIVDIEGGMQPAVNEERTVAVVFNGEIVNYAQLRAELIEQGVRFSTNSEVETLLHLYLRDGTSLFSRLNGQFAVAIWDARDGGKLVLGRDRFGIRPLFWRPEKDGGLTFGSEIKALAARGDGALSLNRKALAQTFRFWTVVGDTSPFEGIYQLPPGYTLTQVGTQKPTVDRYWSMSFPALADEGPEVSEEDYYAQFREQFDAAISRQSMADVTVGSYLSGGIDSSIVAIRLQKMIGQENLRTYSIAFEDKEYDESDAQDAVAKEYGFDHTSVRISASDISDNFPQVVWQAEAPLFRTAPVPLFLLSRRVHQDGIKVVMTGEGADEMLLGYDLFRETAVRRFWGRQPDSKWRGQLFRKLYHYLPQFKNPRYANMMLDFYRPFLKDEDNNPHYPMAVRWANGQALNVYLSDEYKSELQSYDPVEDLDAWLFDGYAQGDDIERAQSIEVQSLLANYLLSSQGDRMSMGHAVEGRYPYLDNEFTEFAARLPRNLKLRGLKDKYILRNAFGNEIPDIVRNRPKVAYQAPDMKSFFIDGKLPSYADKLLSPERIREVGLFDPQQVSRLVEKGRTFNLDRVGFRDNMAFVLILSTMLLDDIFVRKNTSFASDVGVAPKLRLV